MRRLKTLADGDTVGVTVEATIRVHILDQTGATVLKVVQTGRSNEGFMFVYGEGWTAHRIEEPVRQATQTALEILPHTFEINVPTGVVARLSGAIRPTVSTD